MPWLRDNGKPHRKALHGVGKCACLGFRPSCKGNSERWTEIAEEGDGDNKTTGEVL